jgi:hypothetical protein
MLAAAVALRFVEVDSSTTTETTVSIPSIAPASAGPSPSTTSGSVQPTQLALQTTQVKTTRVQAVASDTLTVALLGAVALLILFAVFLDRVTEFGLFGSSFKIGPKERRRAGRAVSRQLHRRAYAFAQQASVDARLLEGPYLAKQEAGSIKMVGLALGKEAPLESVAEAHESGTQQTAAATAQTIDDLEALLRVAKSAPDALPTFAERWKLAPEDIAALRTGELTDELLNRVADRALDQAGAREPGRSG